MPICGRCGVEQAVEDFPVHPALGKGPGPWCTDCRQEFKTITGREYLKAKKLWAQAYMRAYMKNRWHTNHPLAANRFRYRIVSDDFNMKLTVQVSLEIAVIKLEAPFRVMGDHGRRVTDTLGVDPTDIRVSGKGGGKGSRRHPITILRARMEPDDWEQGFVELGKRYRVMEVGR